MLTARELLGVTLQDGRQPQVLGQIRQPLSVIAAGQSGLKPQVSGNIQAADQVVLLKHQADTFPAPARQSRLRATIEGHVVDQNVPTVSAIEPGDQVQQRTFTAARLPHQRQAAASCQAQVDALQHRQRTLGSGKRLAQLFDDQH
ncbi:hypothetical protein D3C84_888470 [compost metagenome]